MSPLFLSLKVLQAQPDSRLVALAREGHEPAFEALVRRYRKELLAYCRRLQPQPATGEDALQQTLLQAWKALSAGTEVRDARPWLYRIAHNVALNNLRAATPIYQEIPDVPGEQSVDQVVEQRLRARAALAGVAALPTLQRQVFVSTTLGGASHEEVANALGLSSGAVRGLIYRARAVLRSTTAALIPSPALQWVARHAEPRAAEAPLAPALAGGSGAGIAAAIAKGGAVLTLAGAVAGASGVAVPPAPGHHRHRDARLVSSAISRQTSPTARESDQAGLGSGRTAHRSQRRASAPRPGSLPADGRGRSRDSHGAVTAESRGASDDLTSSGSDDGSGSGATQVSPSSGSSGSDGGSDGGTIASSAVTTASSSGPDGGTSGGGPGPSGGGQSITDASASDGGSGSGSDGSGSAGSSGSDGGTVTTSSSQ